MEWNCFVGNMKNLGQSKKKIILKNVSVHAHSLEVCK